MSNRRVVLALSSFAFLTLPVAAARAQFEGVVSMHVSSTSGGTDMAYLIKGDRMRIDVGNAQMSMYLLAKQGEMTMVMPAQKVYLSQPVATDAVKSKSASKISIKATGKMETVAGYKCEHFLISGSSEGEMDACLSKELGNFMQPINPMQGRGTGANAGDDVLAHLGGNAFPLKVSKVGGATTLAVTKIEKKPLDASLFTVPSDFTKLDINAMRGGRPPQQ